MHFFSKFLLKESANIYSVCILFEKKNLSQYFVLKCAYERRDKFIF